MTASPLTVLSLDFIAKKYPNVLEESLTKCMDVAYAEKDFMAVAELSKIIVLLQEHKQVKAIAEESSAIVPAANDSSTKLSPIEVFRAKSEAERGIRREKPAKLTQVNPSSNYVPLIIEFLNTQEDATPVHQIKSAVENMMTQKNLWLNDDHSLRNKYAKNPVWNERFYNALKSLNNNKKTKSQYVNKQYYYHLTSKAI